jgi:hypothetical protein
MSICVLFHHSCTVLVSLWFPWGILWNDDFTECEHYELEKLWKYSCIYAQIANLIELQYELNDAATYKNTMNFFQNHWELQYEPSIPPTTVYRGNFLFLLVSASNIPNSPALYTYERYFQVDIFLVTFNKTRFLAFTIELKCQMFESTVFIKMRRTSRLTGTK